MALNYRIFVLLSPKCFWGGLFALLSYFWKNQTRGSLVSFLSLSSQYVFLLCKAKQTFTIHPKVNRSFVKFKLHCKLSNFWGSSTLKFVFCINWEQVVLKTEYWCRLQNSIGGKGCCASFFWQKWPKAWIYNILKLNLDGAFLNSHLFKSKKHFTVQNFLFLFWLSQIYKKIQC